MMRNHVACLRIAFFSIHTPIPILATLLVLLSDRCDALSMSAVVQDDKGQLTAKQVDGRLQEMGASQIRRDEKKTGRPIVLLDLSGTKIERGAFSVLIPYIQETENLNLMASNVGDDELKEIVKLPKLHTLSLNSTNVTDKGLEQLDQLKNLEELDLTLTNIDGSGLKKSKAPLKKLHLGGTKTTDKSIEGIIGLKDLRELDLSYTDLSDKGLKELERIRF